MASVQKCSKMEEKKHKKKHYKGHKRSMDNRNYARKVKESNVATAIRKKRH